MEGAQLQATLLGVPNVMWQGEPVAILRRQPSALLYRLAAELRPVARSHLCYLFWPDVPEGAARRNLTRLLVLCPYDSRNLVVWDPGLGVAFGRDVALSGFWNHRP
jgi:hypothetical protein